MTVQSENNDRPKFVGRPVYVTGLPLCWRGCNGQYSPIFDNAGGFTGMWSCDRETYWGIPLVRVTLKYDSDTQRWVLMSDGGLYCDEVIFASRTCTSDNHPRFVRWPEGICVSHIKPWFWQVL